MAEALGNPEAVDAWLRHWWEYVPDPIEYEFVTAPALQLALAFNRGGQLRGDCDEAATLAASLLTAIRWPCRLVAIRVRPAPDFSHVFCRAPLFEFAGGNSHELNIDIDPIVSASQLPLVGDFEVMTLTV